MKFLDRVLFGLRLHRLSAGGVALTTAAVAGSLAVPIRAPAAPAPRPPSRVVAAGPMAHETQEPPSPSPASAAATPPPVPNTAAEPSSRATPQYVRTTCWYRSADGVTHYYGCWWPVSAS
jgi:hypothetical protein